jgi:hypothetical protein
MGYIAPSTAGDSHFGQEIGPLLQDCDLRFSVAFSQGDRREKPGRTTACYHNLPLIHFSIIWSCAKKSPFLLRRRRLAAVDRRFSRQAHRNDARGDLVLGGGIFHRGSQKFGVASGE